MALSALAIFAYLKIGKKIMVLSSLAIFAYLEIGKKIMALCVLTMYNKCTVLLIVRLSNVVGNQAGLTYVIINF